MVADDHGMARAAPGDNLEGDERLTPELGGHRTAIGLRSYRRLLSMARR
jgi:hypothetical protein